MTRVVEVWGSGPYTVRVVDGDYVLQRVSVSAQTVAIATAADLARKFDARIELHWDEDAPQSPWSDWRKRRWRAY